MQVQQILLIVTKIYFVANFFLRLFNYRKGDKCMLNIPLTNLTRYAKRNHYNIASVKLNDGSSLKVLDNMKDRIEFLHVKNGKILGWKAEANSDSNALLSRFLEICAKLQKYAQKGTILAEDITEQVCNHKFQAMIK